MEIVNQTQLFSYSDYRDCIRDYYQINKSKNGSFSLQSFADRVGLSKMTIKYVIDKKRHLTEESLGKFATAMGLSRNDRLYFYNLALFNKCKDANLKHRYFKKMMDLRKDECGEKLLIESDMGLFKNWLYPTIVELSCIRGFQKNPEWIQKVLKFKVPLQEIRDAISFAETKDLLNDPSAHPPKLKLPDTVRFFIYKGYVKDLIEKAYQAIDNQKPEEREYFNITISVDNDRFDLAKKMISEFRHQLHDALASDVVCDKVIQINMQMFTLAEKENL